MELRRRALELLMQDDPAAKAAAVRQWAQSVPGRPKPTDPPRGDASAASQGATQSPQPPVDTEKQWPEPAGLPGRSARPRLVAPAALAARSAFTREGRAALLHAVAHIEFNAINLALDAVWRFAAMPQDYYLEWMRVAGEEALHFTLLTAHLATLDHAYGDFDAHDGLWAMAERTSTDVLARMALVPRTLEARGLDATPAMREKFARAGDARAAEILDVILRDEIGHVAIGNRWYRWLCARDGLDPLATYAMLATRHHAPRLRAPFNLEARRAAGFDDAELAALTSHATNEGKAGAR